MAIKLIANYSKRLGLPGYSSHQFSVSVETELSAASDIAAESTRLYQLLQSNVDEQMLHTGLVPMPLGKADNFEFIISFVRIICDKSRPTAHWLPHLARAGSFAPWRCRLPDNRFSDTSDNRLSCFII